MEISRETPAPCFFSAADAIENSGSENAANFEVATLRCVAIPRPTMTPTRPTMTAMEIPGKSVFSTAVLQPSKESMRTWLILVDTLSRNA